MRLTRLHLDRLPGIPRPFSLRPAAGVNVILGPNGSGKSSVCRAVGHLLWSDRPGERPFSARGEFAVGDETWTVSREDHDPPVWSRDAAPTSAPVLPAEHLSPCYLLGLADLLDEDLEDGDRELAARIARQLAGGYDLPAAAKDLCETTAREGQNQRKRYDEAAARVRELRLKQADLARRREDLPELETEWEQAKLAGERARLLEKLLEMRRRRRDLADAAQRLTDLPAAADEVRTEDPEQALAALDEIRRSTENRDEARREQERLAGERDALGLPEAAGGDIDREALREQAQRLREDQRTLAEAERAHAALRARLEIVENGSDDEPLPAVDAATLDELIKLQEKFLEQTAKVEELESQELDAGEETTGWTWLLAALPGGLLLLAAAAAALWPEAPVPAAGIAGGALTGAALLAVGLQTLGRGQGRRADRRRAAQARSRALEMARGKLADTRDGLAGWNRELDLDLPVENPRLADLLRQAQMRRRARQDLADSDAGLQQLHGRLNEALTRANADLHGLGLPCGTEAIETADRIDAFLRRRGQWDDLGRDQRDAERAAAAAEETRERRRQDLAHIAERLGAPADAGLPDRARDLLKSRPERERATGDAEAARRELARLESETGPQLALLDGLDTDPLADEELRQRIDEEHRSAERRDDLLRDITGLEGELEQAQRSGALAEALAEQEDARQELAAARDRIGADEMTELLRDDVLEEQGGATTSPLWKAARGNFTRFTRGRYELKIDPRATDEPFFAWDRQRGERRTLGQLSDGTRTQLLLAVRLAFLDFAEKGLRPPLWLDQALAASDPERFDGIARELGRIAAEQERQVFYLGCDAGDIEAWNRALRAEGLPPVHVIDLAAERALGEAALPAITPPPLGTVPAPGDKDAAQYGALLGAPAIDPWAPGGEVPLFHLLRDDLPLLHSLLVAGVERIGTWLGMRGHLAADGTVDEIKAAWLQARADAARTFLEAWRVGRGRPLSPDWIREQDIFTGRMLPEVLTVNEEVGRDPERLLEAMRGKRIARLNRKHIDEFEDALAASGHLDGQPVLDDGQRLLHMRRAMTREVGAGIIDAEELRLLADTLTGALSASAPVRDAESDPAN